MVIWINGSFGVGKSETAGILREKITRSHLYDPEQVGYYLWRIFPEEMQRKGDFQDIPIWRSINYEIIRYLNDTYPGEIIVPMTLVNRSYFAEIVERLEEAGVEVKHFILTASREKIVERLMARGEEKNSWAEQQIDRCLRAFDREIPGIKIDTDSLGAVEVAEVIRQSL